MEQICKNGYCRKKISEYRERTRKLYDDVDTLENDIKDKEDFVQHVVKARNSLQAEISSLEKKNTGLMDKNFELSLKIDELQRPNACLVFTEPSNLPLAVKEHLLR